MGLKFNSHDFDRNYQLSDRKPISETYNVKVALWQIPYDERYSKYDEDDSHWFETYNREGNDEIELVENGLHMSLSRYKAATKAVVYNDGTSEIETLYPKGTTTKESYGLNHKFIQIKDKFNRLVAEKIFNRESHDGRKIIYNHIDDDNGNTFTIVKIFS